MLFPWQNVASATKKNNPVFAERNKSRQRLPVPLLDVGGGIIVLEGPRNIVSWYHLHSTAICQGNVHFITSWLNLKNGKTSPSYLKSFFGLSNFMKYHEELKVPLVFGHCSLVGHFHFQFCLLRIYSLNFQSCLHMGHWCWVCWVPSHFMMQWMWKQWLHWPQTWEIDIQQCPKTSGQQPRTKI